MTEGIALLLGCIQGLTEFLPIPIILGANLLEISRDWQGFTANSTFPITLGLLSAMASGYVALKLLVRSSRQEDSPYLATTAGELAC